MNVQTKMVWLAPLLLSMSLKVCIAAPPPDKVPLCELQRGTKQGEHRPVLVSGTYSEGFEMGVLTDPNCPTQRTWVELDLQTSANKQTLRSILQSGNKAEI